MQKSFKHILVDEKNYELLKKQGQAGDSFNDVISRLLEANQA
jgi:predicted CopG family antitoxin